MVSDDEGKTWSTLAELPDGLTGDRHLARYTSDGRLLVTMRDRWKDGPTHGDFVMWVGTCEDILEGRSGQYRVRLLDNRTRPGETGYAGLERLPDGTFVSTTYCDLSDDGRRDPVIVSLGFRIEEFDRLRHSADRSRRPCGQPARGTALPARGQDYRPGGQPRRPDALKFLGLRVAAREVVPGFAASLLAFNPFFQPAELCEGRMAFHLVEGRQVGAAFDGVSASRRQ